MKVHSIEDDRVRRRNIRQNEQAGPVTRVRRVQSRVPENYKTEKSYPDHAPYNSARLVISMQSRKARFIQIQPREIAVYRAEASRKFRFCRFLGGLEKEVQPCAYLVRR